jgi:radical SAM protein with 4Fe4S-binding SPASM domain
VTVQHSELRVLRWADRIQDVLAGEVRGPIRANIDLTNLCSHSCPWCEPLDFRKATIADKSHTLPLWIVERTIDDLKLLDCKAIQFSGGGEPTLYQDFDMALAHAHCCGLSTFVVTHGGYIDRWLEPLRIYADRVRVSLDASCQEEHAIMHRSKPGEFDRIIEGIRALVEARGTTKTPEVGITYNVADCNKSYDSFMRLFELCINIGVDYVQVRPLSEPTELFLHESWSEDIPQIPVPFRLDILGQRDKDVFFQRDFDRCYAAITLAVISANGDVTACCDRRDIVFGNVNQTRFKDIWLSVAHRDKANAIVPMLCQRCVLCGFNKSVKKYVVENEATPEFV